jgi:diguanylate cyclase (GGDEF)-like protein
MFFRNKFKNGIRIRTYNNLLMLVTIIVSILLLYSMVQINTQFHLLLDSEQAYQTGLNNANELQDGSDNLTIQVQHFVTTTDLTYLNNYFEEVRSGRREAAVENFSELAVSEDGYALLTQAMEESDSLMELEYHAMKLVLESIEATDSQIPSELLTYALSDEEHALSAEEKVQLAIQLVFDENYQEQKDAIDYDITQFTSSILSRLSAENQQHFAKTQSIIGHGIFCVLLMITVILAICVIWHTQVIDILENYIQSIILNKPLERRGAYEFRYLAESYNQVSDEISQENKRLHHCAEHDALTGLLNRSSLEQAIERSLDSKDTSSACGVFLLVDVDRFKNINDSYGHASGDQLLQHVADLLRETFAPEHLVARFGGDEFAVWLHGIGLEQADFVKDCISKINEKLLHPTGTDPKGSVSVGVAFAKAGDSFASFYKKADEALYQVKERGRCGVQVYLGSES